MTSKSASRKKAGNSRRGNGGEKDRSIDELNDHIAVLERSMDLIRLAPIAIYEVDLHGPRFKSVNDYMCQATGYTREELLAMDPGDLLDAESKARFRKRVKQLLAGKKIDDQVEYRGKAKDGHETYWLLKETFTYVDGTPEGAIVVGQEITGRKRAEEELKASSQKINEILASIQDDFYVLDRNWNFVYASRQFTSRIGKEPKDFIGNNIWEMFPRHLGTALEENYRAAMDRREVRRFELRGKYTDSWYRMTAFPSADGITVLGTDITERRRAEEALRAGEARFRSVLDNSQDVIYRVNVQTGRYEYISPSVEGMVGYSPNEIMTQDVQTELALIHPDDLPAVQAALTRLENTGTAEAVYRQRTKSGDYRWMSNHLSLTRDDAGRPLYRNGNIRDVTELKRADEERRKALETLRWNEDQFLALVQNLKSGIALIDETGKFAMVNPAFLRMFGLGRESDILNVNSQDWSRWEVYGEDGKLLPVDDHPVRKAATTGKPAINRLVAVRNPGASELTWMLISAKPLLREDGHIYRIICTYHDITERRLVEEALRESKAKLEAVIESMSDAISISDTEGNFIDFNEAFATYHKFRNKEECYKTLAEYPDYIDVYFADGTLAPLDMWAVSRALRGETVSNAEYILRRKDTGETWWGSYSFAPVRDAGGRIVGSVVSGRDITERKLAEKETWESQAKLKAVFSSMNDGVGIVDTAGKVIDVNDALARFHRFQNKVDYVKNLDDYNRILNLYTMDGRLLRPDEWPIRRALAGEARESRELRIERKDTGETWFGSYSYSPVRDRDGKVIAGIITTRDITGRKQTEAAREQLVAQLKEKTAELQHMYEELEVKTEEMAAQAEELECANEELRTNNEELQKVSSSLHEVQDYLESLLNYANAPIIVWDHGFVITRFNHAFERLSGYTASEVIGRDLSILFPPDSRAESLDKIQKTLEGEHWESVEIPILHKYGSIRIALWNSANIYGSDNALIATIAQGQDITSRKQVETDLEEAKAQAELYLDLMGHDISNLHQIIMMQLELAGNILKADGILKGEDADLIDKSIRTLDKAARLIEHVRKLQKLRTGEFSLEAVDLCTTLQESIKTYTNVPGRDVRITFSSRPGSLVRANPLLKDVFDNLLDNSVKHSGGTLEIGIGVHRVRLNGSTYYRVTIEDNGNGIPDDKKEEVFQRFLRGHTKAKGTGLGLYLVKSLVEGFGGYVEVQDRVLGDHTKGTRFLAYLPLAGQGNDAGG